MNNKANKLRQSKFYKISQEEANFFGLKKLREKSDMQLEEYD